MSTVVGSCGCGQTQYKLNSEIMSVVNCHCNMCRNHNGSAFSTYAALPLAALEFTKGKENIKNYKFGTATKHFCSHCGTPLFNTNEKYPGAGMVYAGTLSISSDITPGVNVWCESQLPWVINISGIKSIQNGIPEKNA